MSCHLLQQQPLLLGQRNAPHVAAHGWGRSNPTPVPTPEEREHWRALSLGLPAPAELLLRFSLKEALYKALHPLVRSPIRWHAVRVRPRRGGGCDVELGALEEEAGARIAAHAAWSREDEHFVTTARALLLPTDAD